MDVKFGHNVVLVTGDPSGNSDCFVIRSICDTRQKYGGKFFQFFPIYYLVMAVTLKRIQSSKKRCYVTKNKCNLHIMSSSDTFNNFMATNL